MVLNSKQEDRIMSGYTGASALKHSSKTDEVDMSDENLKVVWKAVCADKDPTTWCGFGFADEEQSTKLVVLGSGKGGVKDLVAL